MDQEMKEELQAVLERVREPETHLSVSDLGLVQGIRHDKDQRKLLVFLNTVRPGPLCCSIMGGLLLSTTKRNLSEELEKTFPDLSVKFV